MKINESILQFLNQEKFSDFEFVCPFGEPSHKIEKPLCLVASALIQRNAVEVATNLIRKLSRNMDSRNKVNNWTVVNCQQKFKAIFQTIPFLWGCHMYIGAIVV